MSCFFPCVASAITLFNFSLTAFHHILFQALAPNFITHSPATSHAIHISHLGTLYPSMSTSSPQIVLHSDTASNTSSHNIHDNAILAVLYNLGKFVAIFLILSILVILLICAQGIKKVASSSIISLHLVLQSSESIQKTSCNSDFISSPHSFTFIEISFASSFDLEELANSSQ